MIGSKDPLDEIAKNASYHEPKIGFISSWTGQVVRKEGLNADYWKPHKHTWNIPKETLVISAQSDWKELVQTLGQLYLNGALIDWKAFDASYSRKKYPYQPILSNKSTIGLIYLLKNKIPPHIDLESAKRHPFLIRPINSPFLKEPFLKPKSIQNGPILLTII